VETVLSLLRPEAGERVLDLYAGVGLFTAFLADVVGRWWEQLLHNQTALRLKGKLLFTPGVMVTSVPYQLQSSQIARDRARRESERVKAGDLRRGTIRSGGQVPPRRQVHR
jgi:hypothetical protein